MSNEETPQTRLKALLAAHPQDEMVGVARADLEALVGPLQWPNFHRYTITSKGASKGYFRLEEDAKGPWLTWAEVDAWFSKRD